MAKIRLRIDQLMLDTDNPRISHSETQRQAMQKVIRDQKSKLIRLAESIVDKGLSPIELMMVLAVQQRPKRYIALEGNRRVAALTLLNNPSGMGELDIPASFKKTFERLSEAFKERQTTIEPIECFEVASLEESRFWIELRHNGEDEGRGIVGWKPIVAARFRHKEPAIQALDLVLENGGFADDEIESIKTNFSITTLRRLIVDASVQKLIGVAIKDDKLQAIIEPTEVLKPLKRIVLDIHNKIKDSRSFNKKQQMIDYVSQFSGPDKPDLTKVIHERPINSIAPKDAAPKISRGEPSRRSPPSPAHRKTVVPKGIQLRVTDNRIAEIYGELQKLKLDDSRNAIAVLMRVFLELSIDHFLENNGSSATKKTGGGEQNKKLENKMAEVVQMLLSRNVPKRHLEPVQHSIGSQTSPLSVNLFHQYVHNRFATPSPADLTAAWDKAQPLFAAIWP